MSDPILWKCLFNGVEELTVGKEFNLHCEGTIGAPLQKNLALTLPESLPPFTLKLLAVTEVTPTSLDVKLTAYRPGQFKAPYLRLSDGTTTIDTGEMEWSVKALATQESKPTPPIGPFGLDLPGSIYVIGSLILAVLVLAIGLFIFRKNRKAHLEALLEEHKSHMSPLRQFEAEMRRLRKEIFKSTQMDNAFKKEIVRDLDRAIRVYWLKKFRRDTMGMGRRKIVKRILENLKKPEPQTWNRYFIELDHSLAKSSHLDQSSLILLVEQSSQVLHQYENAQKKTPERNR